MDVEPNLLVSSLVLLPAGEDFRNLGISEKQGKGQGRAERTGQDQRQGRLHRHIWGMLGGNIP